MAKSNTALAMEAAVDGGASEVLGAIFEHQAACRRSEYELLEATKDAEIARLTRQRDEAWDRVAIMEERIFWLFGHERQQLAEHISCSHHNLPVRGSSSPALIGGPSR